MNFINGRLLTKNPADRYQNAKLCLEAINHAQGGILSYYVLYFRFLCRIGAGRHV